MKPPVAPDQVDAPVTLSPEYVAQLGLDSAVAGDTVNLSFNVKTVNPDGSMDVEIENESTAEDASAEDAYETGESPMGKRPMAPAMMAVLTGVGKK